MSDTDRLAATRSGDRPRTHEGNSDAEVAIFDATERLLADTPFYELSVAQIIAEAGISRATFYFYFSSKFAVLSGLLARVIEEMFEVIQPFTQRDEAVTPQKALEDSLSAVISMWVDHRPALRAIHEHWNTTDELRFLWSDAVQRFTQAAAAELDRERTAGLARNGVDSRQLAAALIWSTERCLYVSGLDVDPNLGNETQAITPLLMIWNSALYGS